MTPLMCLRITQAQSVYTTPKSYQFGYEEFSMYSIMNQTQYSYAILLKFILSLLSAIALGNKQHNKLVTMFILLLFQCLDWIEWLTATVE